MRTERFLQLKRKQLAAFVFLAQGIGAIFYAVFLASYALALPSNQVLHDLPVFRIPLSIFGGLFILSTVILLLLSFLKKPRE
jgi:hypothetical protein